MCDTMKAHRVLVGTPVLGKPRRRWENDIKMAIRVIGYGGMEWIHCNEPWGSIKFWGNSWVAD
jgi:hypothetical protein